MNMKMKEVLQQTGLTDRAVRLYIRQGLVCPTQTQSYTGYRHIDFSAQDVSVLRQIALLRRADFSIAEIRSMQQDGSSIPQIVQAYRLREQANGQNKQDIFACWCRLCTSGSRCW